MGRQGADPTDPRVGSRRLLLQCCSILPSSRCHSVRELGFRRQLLQCCSRRPSSRRLIGRRLFPKPSKGLGEPPPPCLLKHSQTESIPTPVPYETTRQPQHGRQFRAFFLASPKHLPSLLEPYQRREGRVCPTLCSLERLTRAEVACVPYRDTGGVPRAWLNQDS